MVRPRSIFLCSVLAVPVTALAIAGCGGDDDDNGGGSSSAPATTATQASGGGGGTLNLSADPSGALKFQPTELTAKAGKVTLVMKNPDSAGVEHGVAVEGKGVDKDGNIVEPGGTSKVTANLKKGKYEFYCPFDGHKGQGMTGTLTVQ